MSRYISKILTYVMFTLRKDYFYKVLMVYKVINIDNVGISRTESFESMGDTLAYVHCTSNNWQVWAYTFNEKILLT